MALELIRRKKKKEKKLCVARALWGGEEKKKRIERHRCATEVQSGGRCHIILHYLTNFSTICGENAYAPRFERPLHGRDVLPNEEECFQTNHERLDLRLALVPR